MTIYIAICFFKSIMGKMSMDMLIVLHHLVICKQSCYKHAWFLFKESKVSFGKSKFSVKNYKRKVSS